MCCPSDFLELLLCIRFSLIFILVVHVFRFSNDRQFEEYPALKLVPDAHGNVEQ